MANLGTTSRQALDRYSSACRTDRELDPPHPGLGASHLSSIGHSQPAAGQASAPPAGGHELQGAAVSRDARQTSPSPTSQSSTMTSSVQATTTGVRQAYPNVYSELHPWQHWRYYDPSRLRQPSSHLQSSSLFSSPPLSDPHPQPAADPMLEPLLMSLRALQSQFTVFQQSLGDINSDVKGVLSELHALRTAQNKTDMRIAQLEDVTDVTSAGTRARGLGRWGRVRRSRGGRADTRIEPLLDADGADVAIVPEALVQSMASVQSTVEELLARERHASRSYPSADRDMSTSTPRDLPSMDLTGLKSSHMLSPFRSIIDPSQQPSASQFVPRTKSASQSELSSPLSSIATPGSEFDTLPSRMAAAKDYVDVSIQASSPSPASEFSSDFSHGNIPGFTPVDWGIDLATAVQPDRNFQHLTHFPRDARFPSAINAMTDSDCDHSLRGSTVLHAQLPVPSSLPYPETLQAQSESAILPASSSSPGTLVMPTADGPATALDALPSPERISIQGSSLQAPLTSEVVDGLPRTRPSGSRLSVGSSLSSLTSVDDTPISAPGTSVPIDQLDLGMVRMIPDMANDAVPVTGSADVHVPEPVLTAMEGCRPSTPVEANKEVSHSALPTPQPEAFTPDRGTPRAVNHLARVHGVSTDPQLGRCTHLAQSFSVVSTRPSRTSESVQKDQETLPGVRRGSVRQASLGAFSQSLSPLTPPLLSPHLAIGDLGGGAESASRGHGVSGEHIYLSGNSKDTAIFGDADLRVAVDVETSPSAVGSGVPVLTVSNGSPQLNAVSNNVSSPMVAGDLDLFMTPESSLRQHNIGLPDCNPDADAIAPVCSQLDGYDFRFSFPWRRCSPSTSAAAPRYATPSDSSNSLLTQEEDEVWGTLMFGMSGILTPAVDTASLPLVHSRRPSRPPSVPCTSQQQPTSTSTSAPELFSVNPSMLHDAPPLLRGPESRRVQRDRNGSLSSLTSLDEDNMDVERPSKKLRVDEHDRGSRGGRRSEPCRASPPSRAPSKSDTVESAGRVALGATNVDGRPGSRPLGGPGASLDDLLLLARREPLKIRLKVPEKMRTSKRKQDAVDREDAVAGGEGDSAVGKHGRVRPGAGTRVEDALRQGQARVVRSAASETVPHSRIEAATSASSEPKPKQTGAAKGSKSRRSTTDRERLDAMPHTSVPRKVPRKRNEHGEKDAPATCTTSPNASVHQKKSKRGPKVKRKAPIKYHVWNGQIVAVELGPTATPPTSMSELQPHAPVTSSTSQPAVRAKEASQNSRMPARSPRRKERENEATESPLSSPVSHRSARHTRFADSSPMKEDVWNDIHDDSREWPGLPETFGHWDVQFIQCDNCDKWYHYGCVAIKANDPRLEPSAVFICPKCHNHSARRQTLRHNDDVCARPDCPEPQVTGASETFYVEKLVGRKQMEGYIYMWLAKWEGYPMSQATWIPKENVLGDGTRLFNAFLEDALEEGADLSDNLILLQEAIEAGWEEK